MNLPNTDLWNSLLPAELEDAVRCFLEADDVMTRGVRPEAVKALAKALHFRPVFLQKRTISENVPLFIRHLNGKTLKVYRDDAIRSLLLMRHRPMIGAFLDGCSIPHDDGFVGDAVPPPSVGQFEEGINKIKRSYEARLTALYWGFLMIYGGDLWVNLAEALQRQAVDVAGILKPEAAVEAAGADAVEEEPADRVATAEDSEVFTTLDNWLIRATVASAFGETGSLNADQLGDLIEEVIYSNAQRQHSLFHLGYFHALFGKPLQFQFPGDNLERRLWYFTGVILGMLRSKGKSEMIPLLKQQHELFKALAQNVQLRCGRMIVMPLLPILWDAGEYGMLRKLADGQTRAVSEERRMDLVIQLHYNSSAMLRRGQWAEAAGFLEFVDDVVKNPDISFPEGFREWLLPTNDRKRAQAFQLRGDFASAADILNHLQGHEKGSAGSVLADLGLIRGGFRSLASILPQKDQQAAKTIADSLEKGVELFKKSLENHPDSATNACFCLGILQLLRVDDSTSTSDYLRVALSGMVGDKESLYSEGGILQWTRFLLGISILETAEPSEFLYASDMLRQSLADPIKFPLWLWSRAMKAAALFDDTELGVTIAGHLLKERSADACSAIWDSGLALNVTSLRKTYLDWLFSAKIPAPEKWAQMGSLLRAALTQGDLEAAERILDTMEEQAESSSQYRLEFLEVLGNERHFSPAWSAAEAAYERIKLHEMEGQLDHAVSLLRARFFEIRAQENPFSRTEAESILEWMGELRANPEDLEQLRGVLPVEGSGEPQETCPLASGTPVFVLYVGGNETQAAYRPSIESELLAAYPGLRVEFYFPGWGSNWNVHLEKIRPLIHQANAIVLNRLVRTNFGRHVRAACGNENPWFPCTGRGKASLKRSIECAARWAASEKSQKCKSA